MLVFCRVCFLNHARKVNSRGVRIQLEAAGGRCGGTRAKAAPRRSGRRAQRSGKGRRCCLRPHSKQWRCLIHVEK